MNNTLAQYLQDVTGITTLSVWIWCTVSVLAIILGPALLFSGISTYVERKISADFQARIGPNRVGPWGLLQFIADGIKLLLKEDTIPKDADRKLFKIAPFLTLLGFFLAWIVVPFSERIIISDLEVGVLYSIAVTGFIGIGGMMAGYASNNKWSMLGGMRVAAQAVSYEIPVLISAMTIVMIAGSMRYGDIIRLQGVWPWEWYIFHNPFTIVIFFISFVAQIAEINRTPFDLPEGESELVAGNLTEYSGMRFGLFQMAEFGEQAFVAAILTALFLGGWNAPFLESGDMSIPAEIFKLMVFTSKFCLIWFILIWVRWTYPRLRVDQLMNLSWKYLTPIGFFCLLGSAVWMVVFKNKSMFELVKSLF